MGSFCSNVHKISVLYDNCKLFIYSEVWFSDTSTKINICKSLEFS